MSQRSDQPTGHEAAAQIDYEAGMIRVGHQYLLPRKFSVTIDDTEIPAVVLMRVEVGDDGEARCRELSIRPRDKTDVTTATLRALPMKALLRQAATAVMEKVESDQDGDLHLAPMRAADVERFSATYGRKRSARRIPPQELRRVLEIYHDAKRSDDPSIRRAPTQAVASALYISRATAGRWLAAAKAAEAHAPDGASGETEPPPLTADELKAAETAGMSPERFHALKGGATLEEWERLNATDPG